MTIAPESGRERAPVARVIVVDDHDLIRIGICGMLEDIERAVVVGQAASGEEALEQVRELQPDIVLMDLRMPGIGGLEATRRILQRYPEVKVIVVSAVTDDVYPNRLLKAGASGYITKNSDGLEIGEAIRQVMNGRVYVSPAIAQQMVVSKLGGDGESPVSHLSQRELQIAQMITSGRRASEVAEMLSVSPKTINTYKYRIYEKFGVSNDVELTLAAVRFGLIDPGETH